MARKKIDKPESGSFESTTRADDCFVTARKKKRRFATVAVVVVGPRPSSAGAVEPRRKE